MGMGDARGLSDAEIGAYRDTYLDLNRPYSSVPTNNILGKYSPIHFIQHLAEFDENPGRDITSKTALWGARYGIAGFVWGGMRCLYSMPGYARLGTSLPYFTGLGLVCGVTGAAGITAAQAITGKNDEIAWAIGGFCFGSSLFAFSRNWRTGIWIGAFGAFFGFAFKNTEAYGKPKYDDFALRNTWE